MKYIFRILFFFSFIIFFTFESDSKVKKVSLSDCINIAVANHPDIQLARENERASKASLDLIKSSKRPTVIARMQTKEFDRAAGEESDTLLDNDKNVGINASLTASYPLYKPGYAESLKVSHKDLDLTKLSNRDVVETIILTVKDNYYGYIRAINTTILKKRMMNNYAVRLEQVKIFVENGERPVLDLSSMEVKYANVSLDYKNAINNEANMKAELLNSMGLSEEDIEFEVDMLDELNLKSYKLPILKYEISDLYKLAETYSPTMIMSKINKEKSRLNIAKAQSVNGLRVNIFGYAGYEHQTFFNEIGVDDRYDKKNWGKKIAAGFNIALPIFDGGATSATVDLAVSDFNKARYQERKAKIDVRKNVKYLYMGMKENRDRVKISILNIENAKTNLTLAQKSYINGIGSQSEIHDAEASLLNAELALLNTRISYLNSLAKLSKIIGVGEDILCKK